MLLNEPYVPTIDLDDKNLATAVSMGYLKLKPGQWVMRDGEKCRFLYVRGNGVMFFNKPGGDTTVMRSARLKKALEIYRFESARIAAEAEDSLRQRMLDNHKASMSVFGRIGYVLKG